MPNRFQAVISAVVLILATSCGDSESACERAGKRLCELACDCGKDACVVAVTSDPSGVGSLSFDSYEKCTALYVDLGCSQGGDPDVNHQSCLDQLQSAQCAGLTPDAMLLPPACASQE